jgi:hypothetical protein
MQLNFQGDKEQEYRRSLFRAAAKGDVRAKEELEREYHVRIRCNKGPRHRNGRRKTK